MATKYLNLAGLQKYDELIKNYIGERDAAAIKYAVIDDGSLKMYRSENPEAGATPDFEFALTANLLRELLDVSLESLADGQTLVYDATSGKWENRTLSSICFVQDGSNDVIIDGGDAADLT